MKLINATGEGLSSCDRCDSMGKWNRSWLSMMLRIEKPDGGLYPGCYCGECAAILREMSYSEFETLQLKQERTDENA